MALLSIEEQSEYIIQFELYSNRHYEEVMVIVEIFSGVNTSLGPISKLFE